MDLVEALLVARPGEHWTLNGETLEGLNWLSDTEPPTQDEIQAAWQQIEKQKSETEAAEKSAREAAIAHAKSLGFTDEMIAVMYPGLTV